MTLINIISVVAIVFFYCFQPLQFWLEFGSYHGGSAIRAANALKKAGLEYIAKSQKHPENVFRFDVLFQYMA